MSFRDDSKGRLFYTLEIEVNRFEFNPRYPKHHKIGERIRKDVWI